MSEKFRLLKEKVDALERRIDLRKEEAGQLRDQLTEIREELGLEKKEKQNSDLFSFAWIIFRKSEPSLRQKVEAIANFLKIHFHYVEKKCADPYAIAELAHTPKKKTRKRRKK